LPTGIRNWWLESNGFLARRSLPALCHQFLDGTLQDPTQLQTLANQVSLGGAITDLSAFAQSYLDIFARGYNYAFMIAAIAMVISLVVYMVFNKMLPNKEKSATQQTISFGEKPMAIVPALLVGILAAVGISLLKATATGGTMLDGDNIATGAAFGLFAVFVTWIITISRKEERQRVIALTLVFLVVIFFWMSFHQNGLTLTFFARDYTVKAVDPYTYMFFTLENILSVIALIAGLVIVLGRKRTLNTRLMGAALLVAGSTAAFFFFRKGEAENPISPEVFQSFNPLFIVTPHLHRDGILLVAEQERQRAFHATEDRYRDDHRRCWIPDHSGRLPQPRVTPRAEDRDETGVVKFSPVPDSSRVMPYWLISSYLVLTVAELSSSAPFGLSLRLQGSSWPVPGSHAGWLASGLPPWVINFFFVGSTSSGNSRPLEICGSSSSFAVCFPPSSSSLS
jgi:POT family proton-dependent oligopeptide transporter